ncbi:MFS transporter [Roseomonas sp. M0104]|uniref:MFS transporter n=1 Tax=Teichococcus coralli TaxID=2545983 RepID=A0A845BA63_9PROT|nr:MFS transporter [Pseudoroseomonas coralli]MXP62986.1 MFS transporter [Pseudoroseomonas coralli]
MPPGSAQFRLLTLHFSLFHLAATLAGGFVGAYLLKLGFSLPAALASYAGLLMLRFGLRFVALGITRRFGFKGALTGGVLLGAAQFVPLLNADTPFWFAAWVAIVAAAESLYWPVYHAAMAVTGEASRRGRELGLRTAIAAVIGVLGPLAGGLLLEHAGPAADFAIAGLLALLSIPPFLHMAELPAGPVPALRESMRGMDRLGLAAFAADGWIASGLLLAWPMVLFAALGARYEAFGLANAVAGLAGAVAGVLCGRAIDRGQRERYLAGACVALGAGFLLRAGAGWSPLAAAMANATGAAIMSLYMPVLMSVVYDRAKQSGAAYRFHFATEAGWDVGAASGCLAAAAVAWLAMTPSLAVLPGMLGVAVLYLCVRQRRVSAPLPVSA